MTMVEEVLQVVGVEKVLEVMTMMTMMVGEEVRQVASFNMTYQSLRQHRFTDRTHHHHRFNKRTPHQHRQPNIWKLKIIVVLKIYPKLQITLIFYMRMYQILSLRQHQIWQTTEIICRRILMWQLKIYLLLHNKM